MSEALKRLTKAADEAIEAAKADKLSLQWNDVWQIERELYDRAKKEEQQQAMEDWQRKMAALSPMATFGPNQVSPPPYTGTDAYGRDEGEKED